MGILYTPSNRASLAHGELFGAGKLLETFGPILAGTMAPIYLDSQVAVMALGGTIPTYPHKKNWGSKTLVSWIYDL